MKNCDYELINKQDYGKTVRQETRLNFCENTWRVGEDSAKNESEPGN